MYYISFILMSYLFISNLIDSKTKKRIKFQKKMLKDESGLFFFVLIVLCIYGIIIYMNPVFMNDETIKNIVNGVALSIIAAFIFYLFTDFIPRSRQKRYIYSILYFDIKSVYDKMKIINEICNEKRSKALPASKDLMNVIYTMDKNKHDFLVNYFVGMNTPLERIISIENDLFSFEEKKEIYIAMNSLEYLNFNLAEKPSDNFYDYYCSIYNSIEPKLKEVEKYVI